jgi:hypothetical protein
MEASFASLGRETFHPNEVDQERTLSHHNNFHKFLTKSQSHSCAGGVFDEKALLPMSWELITCL